MVDNTLKVVIKIYFKIVIYRQWVNKSSQTTFLNCITSRCFMKCDLVLYNLMFIYSKFLRFFVYLQCIILFSMYSLCCNYLYIYFHLILCISSFCKISNIIYSYFYHTQTNGTSSLPYGSILKSYQFNFQNIFV